MTNYYFKINEYYKSIHCEHVLYTSFQNNMSNIVSFYLVIQKNFATLPPIAGDC